MAVIAFVLHPDRPEAAEVATRTIDGLLAAGHTVRLPCPDASRVGHPELGVDDDHFADGLDLALSLGGDGTMLRTVALVARTDTPIMGVNFGSMGYLTDVEPEAIDEALAAVLSGTHEIEERMLLEVEVTSASGDVAEVTSLALNEAVLEKTAGGHTIRLDVDLDDVPFTPYAADGLIVATPTGSTAYAFSARGPIVEPTHRAVLLTPVSPHMLFDRTLVLDPDADVRLTVTGEREAALIVDGRHLGILRPGDVVRCRASAHVARFVLSGPRDFHAILKAKFGLADR